MANVLTRAKALLGGPEPSKTKFDTKVEAKGNPGKRPSNQFHAVSIVPGSLACAAAHGLSQKRFLSREAPVLPLKTCDRGDCECRYEHHEDRRKGPRRATDMGISVDGYDGSDKRSGSPKRGRRKTDR